MRQLNRILMTLAFLALVGYLAHLGYQARLTYIGYCHDAEKYLSDGEQINAAIGELLKNYPPNVELRLHHPAAAAPSLLRPLNPIHYRDIDEFTFTNPECCKVKPTSAYMEGGRLSLVQILTGTATNVTEINYLVRFKDEQDKPRAIKTIAFIHTDNCGAPGRPWSPTD